MSLLNDAERHFLSGLSELIYCNPFQHRRIELEKELLGPEFAWDTGEVWSRHVQWDEERPNVQWLKQQVEATTSKLRDRLADAADVTEQELLLYEDAALYVLYHRFWQPLQDLIDDPHDGRGQPRRITFWDQFKADFDFFLSVPKRRLPSGYEPAHVLAFFYQIRRAFHHIYHFILGQSKAAARLRAAIWQSIFTHDMRRYRRHLYDRIGDIAVMITGPSGTGKELVARAIALARYIPLTPDRKGFEADYSQSFHALNLSALSPTLIESELFGHRRGAFTGAVDDRIGWFETCGSWGTVFLDEIGDVDLAIQVKMLRVLQTRVFQRLGETGDCRFEGKVITATNRDLPEAIRLGRFRQDFYYRLCSDTIVTPSLREQLDDAPGDLRELVLFLAGRIAGDAAQCVTDEVLWWIEHHLDDRYPWPGNIRELEQCVRNVLIHNEYRPPQQQQQHRKALDSGADGTEAWISAVRTGSLTADQLLRRYCQLVYDQTGSYEQAAVRLKLDRRTVKSKVADQP